MYTYDDDEIYSTELPTDWDRVGTKKFSDMNILFYYEIRNTNIFSDEFFGLKEFDAELFSTYLEWAIESHKRADGKDSTTKGHYRPCRR